jgi:uncharacterized protein
MLAALHVTLACNLRCTYCYAGSKVEKAMTPDVARKSIDWIATSPDREHVVTLFGGDPLMRFDLCLEAIEHAKGAHSGARWVWRMVTNGTLVTDAILEKCREHDILFTLSLDGDAIAHDLERKTVDGRGSFDLVLRNVPRILEFNPYTKVNMVVTPKTASRLSRSVAYAHGLGFRYLDVSPDFGGAWTRQSFNELRDQIEECARYYVMCHRRGEKLHVNLFDDKIRTWALGQAKPECTSCDAGKTQFAIAPSGRIYPCVQFVKDDSAKDQAYAIGDIERGLDAARHKAFIEVGRRKKTECDGCSFLGRCHNWCVCANWQSTGDPGAPSGFLCEYEQMLIPIADRAGATLWEERNRLFIDKVYNEAYPLTSLLEDVMSGKAKFDV